MAWGNVHDKRYISWPSRKILEEQKRPLSPSEIWKVAVKQGYDTMLKARQGKTPGATLYSAIFTDARQNRRSVSHRP
jgi:hypothetical protein